MGSFKESYTIGKDKTKVVTLKHNFQSGQFNEKPRHLYLKIILLKLLQ